MWHLKWTEGCNRHLVEIVIFSRMVSVRVELLNYVMLSCLVEIGGVYCLRIGVVPLIVLSRGILHFNGRYVCFYLWILIFE